MMTTVSLRRESRDSMNKASFLSALAIATLAVSLTACGDNGDADMSDTSPSPTVEAVASDAGNGETAAGQIREPVGDIAHADVAGGVRAALPTWPEMSDEEIVAALNSGCDGLDVRSEPDDGVQGIASHGVTELDAAFGLLSAIVSYCPEHSELLGN